MEGQRGEREREISEGRRQRERSDFPSRPTVTADGRGKEGGREVREDSK